MNGGARRALLSAWVIALAGCAPRPAVVRRWPVMATYATATALAARVQDGEAAAARVRRDLDRADGAMSNWSARSELSRLNAAARRGPYAIGDPELARCVGAALDGAARTGGTFDPTVGPLMTLWGFRPKAPRVPGGGEIAQALRHVGAPKVVFDAGARTIRFDDDGVELDLGGIAKGCALDLARGDAAKTPGLLGLLLDLGGQLASWGRAPEGGPWTVGVRDPEGEAPIVATLVLREGGTVASSSDVEQAFEIDGRRYGHIMDPRTGRPAETDVLQSTAIDPSATTGDLLSTALFVGGASRAEAILRGYPSAEAILIVRDGGALALLASASLRGRLALSPGARARFTGDSPRFVLPAATMTASADR